MTDPTQPTAPAPEPRRRHRRLAPIAVVSAAALLGALVGGVAVAASGGGLANGSNDPPDAAAVVGSGDDDPTHPTDGDTAHDQTHDEPVDDDDRADHGCLTVTGTGDASDQEGADTFYAAVVGGIERFEDLGIAESEGYEQVPATAHPEVERIRHYMRRGGVNGAALDPDQPSGLMYWVDGDEAVLLGAVWVTTAEDPPQPGGSLTPWHDHHACGCPVTHPDCPAASGELGNPPKMLHVWTFAGAGDPFAHDLMGALPDGHERGDPLPWEDDAAVG